MTSPSIAAQFRKIQLFCGLTDRELLPVTSKSTIRKYPKDQELLSVHDTSTDVFFILSGRVQIRNYSQNGREFIYSEITAGSMFGEFSAIDGKPRSASVIAVDDTVAARMSSRDFLFQLQSNFQIARGVLELLTAKSRALTDRLLEISTHSMRDRVRAELVRLAIDGTHDGIAVTIHPAPTHYQLAARIGSHREAITKELNHLAALGYIRLRRKEIVILDLRKFREELVPTLSA
jgi:CRP-like cAMP-binding protein